MSFAFDSAAIGEVVHELGLAAREALIERAKVRADAAFRHQ